MSLLKPAVVSLEKIWTQQVEPELDQLFFTEKPVEGIRLYRCNLSYSIFV